LSLPLLLSSYSSYFLILTQIKSNSVFYLTTSLPTIASPLITSPPANPDFDTKARNKRSIPASTFNHTLTCILTTQLHLRLHQI
jgi:hypothetical protein